MNSKNLFFALLFLCLLVSTSFADIQIGEGTDTGNHIPIEAYYGYTYSQQIYYQNEIMTSGDITAVKFNYTVDSDSADWFDDVNDIVIYMGHTTKTSFDSTADWIDVTQLTEVYNGTWSIEDFDGGIPGTGWVTITLDTPFTYNNTDNLVIAFDENRASYGASGDEFYCWDSGLTRAIYYYSDGTNPDPAAPPGAHSSWPHNYVSNVVLVGITSTVPPTEPFNPSPADMAEGVLETPMLSWSSNFAETYDVYLDGTLIADDIVDDYYQITDPLDYNTTYQWYVVATNVNGSTTGPTWSFTTRANPYQTIPYSQTFSDTTLPAEFNYETHEESNIRWSAVANYATREEGGMIMEGGSSTGFTTPDESNVWTLAAEGGDNYEHTAMTTMYFNGTGNYMLEFDYYMVYQYNNFYTNMRIDVKDGDGAWVQVGGDYRPDGGDLPWTYEQVDLGNVTSGSFAVRFWTSCKYDVEDGVGNGVYIDNISVDELSGPPQAATNPDPSDGAMDVNIQSYLSWTNGLGTEMVDLYFGTDMTLVDNMDPSVKVLADTLVNMYDPPGNLDWTTEYYWKVVTKNAGGQTPGTTWSFTTMEYVPWIQVGYGMETGKHLPEEPFYGYSYTQVLYYAAEIGDGMQIDQIQYNYSISSDEDGFLGDNGDLVIYMGHTTKTQFDNDSDWISVNDMTQVFNGTWTVDDFSDGLPGEGWVTITLDTPFIYNGSDNLVIGFDENTSGYSSSSDEFYCSTASVDRGIYYYSDGTNPDPSAPPSGTATDYIANVRFEELTYGVLDGTITDVDTGTPLQGVMVTAGEYSATTDASGYYMIDPIRTGTYDVTASMEGYVSQTVSDVEIEEDMTTTQDFALHVYVAPQIAVNPNSFDFDIDMNSTLADTGIMNIANTDANAADLEVALSATSQERVSRVKNLRSVDELYTSSTAARVNPGSRIYVEGLADPNAMTTEQASMPVHAGDVTPLDAGDVLAQWPTNLGLPWGIGYEPDYVWFSDYNTATAYQYEADDDGGATGVEIPLTFGGASWWGDMAYDPNHEGMWIVDVGGDNAVTLFDMETGDMIDQVVGDWSFTSARGVAYDPENDYLWVSGWNHSEIYCAKGLDWDNPGETVLTIPTPNSVAGLAWNCGEGTVWVTSNSSPDYIYELDSATGTILTELAFPDPSGYVGAGCEMNEDGNLWIVSQGDYNAYLVETDASGGCYGGADWLVVDPTEGTIPGGMDEDFDVIAQVSPGVVAGEYWGIIEIDHNATNETSPYEVSVHAEFTGGTADPYLAPDSLYSMLLSGTEWQEMDMQTITIGNAETGNRIMDWEIISGLEPGWISANPTMGTGLYPGDSEDVEFTLDPSGLPPSTYTTTVNFAWDDGENTGNLTAEIMMDVLNPGMVIDPSSFDFTIDLETPPFNDSAAMNIENDGNGDLSVLLETAEQTRVRLDRAGSVLVWNPATGDSEVSGLFFQTWLNDNGYDVAYHTGTIMDYTLEDLEEYDMIFACLGIYSYGYYSLDAGEQSLLESYLDLGEGKSMYCEGGDTWYFDSNNMADYFNINPVADGSGDLATVEGITGTPFEGLSYTYAGANNWMDHIEAISPAYNALQANGGAYYTGVAYYNENVDYYTFGTGFLFGGLDNPDELMEVMMDEHFSEVGSGGWLTINPTEGLIPEGANQDFMVNVQAGDGIYAGDYYGFIEIEHNDPDTENPTQIPVHMQATGGLAVPHIWESNYEEYLLGGDEGEQTATLLWVGNATEAMAYMDWSMDITFDPEVDPWLTATPMEGMQVEPGDADRVLLEINSAGLEEGIYTATMDINWSGFEDDNYGTETVVYTLEIYNPNIDVTPDNLSFTIDMQDTSQYVQTDMVTIDNTGSGPLYVDVDTEIQSRSASRTKTDDSANRLASSNSRVANVASSREANNVLYNTDVTTKNMNLPQPAPVDPQPLDAGDIIYQWPTGLGLPWGVGYEPGYVWINDYNTSMASQFEADDDGGATGVEVPMNFGGASWWGDMAYDPNHEGMWVVDVGGDNAVTLFDMETGDMIDQVIGDWATTSARGVAYDPENDYLWVSGWNHTEIYCAKGLDWDNPGETVLTIPTPNSVAGLAWNCGEETVWVTSNSSPDYIYELDSETGSILTELAFPDPAGYVGGGCEMDENGNLWLISQGTLDAYLVETDASGGCYGAAGGLLSAYFGQPDVTEAVVWAEEDPADLTVKVNAHGQLGGTYYGNILINHNDPDVATPEEVPVVINLENGEAIPQVWPDLFQETIMVGHDVTNLLWIGNETSASALMDWTTDIAYDNGDGWITLDPESGTDVAPGTADKVFMTTNAEGLDSGVYTATINVNWSDYEGNSGTEQVPVAMEVYNPDIQVEDLAYEFALDYETGPTADSALMIISNVGTGPLNVTLDVETQDPTRELPFRVEVSKTKSASRTATRAAKNQSRVANKPNYSKVFAEGIVDPNARSTRGTSVEYPHRDAPMDPGDIVYQWPTGLGLPWGIGYEPGFVWFSDYNTSIAYQYEADDDGGATGVEIPLTFGGASWWGDMAYDPNHQGMWVVNVGGDNAMTLFDMETGDMIDQVIGDWASTSARGVAYDPVNDYLWVSGWNHTEIYCAKGLDWDNPGETVLTIPTPNSVAGLAWNCGEETLWVTSNSSPDYIYELDATDGTILTELPFPDPAGYVGAGCEMDEDGNLWVVSQGTLDAYLVETDASGGCYGGAGDWLWAYPEAGIVYPDEPMEVMIHVNADPIVAGDWYGTIHVNHDDPDVESPVDVAVHALVTGGVVAPMVDVPAGADNQYLLAETQTTTTITAINDTSANALMSFSVAENPEAGWLTADPLEGSGMWPGDSEDITLTYDATGLSVGVYTTDLEITCEGTDPDDPGAVLTVPITLEVYNPDIEVIEMSYSETVDLGDTLEVAMDIYNNGTGPLVWESEIEDEAAPPELAFAPSESWLEEREQARAASVLVWNPATGDSEISGLFFQTWLDDNGYDVAYHTGTIMDYTLEDLEEYDMIFACLGIYSYGYYSLDADEQSLLESYLDLGEGKSMYCEGGDTWYFDSNNMADYFNINPVSDGTGDLSTVEGIAGTPFEGLSYAYTGANNWMDHIEAISPAYNALQANGGAYYTGVAYYNEDMDYYTFGTGFLFGGLDNPDELMEAMMSEHFDLGGGWLSMYPEEGQVMPEDSPQTTTIKFDAREVWAGHYYGRIDVHSNDPEIPVVEVPVDLLVTGGNAEGDIQPQAFDAYLQNGEMDTQMATVTNSDSATALMEWTLTVPSEVDWLECSPSAGNMMEPGDAMDVEFIFTAPAAQGVYSTTVDFYWTDGLGASGTVNIPVSLEVYDPAITYNPTFINFEFDLLEDDAYVDSTTLQITNDGTGPLIVDLKTTTQSRDVETRKDVSSVVTRDSRSSVSRNVTGYSEALTAEGLNLPAPASVNNTPLDPGDILAQWPTGLGLPWGVGYEPGFVWFSDYNTSTAYQFEADDDGGATGVEIPLNFGGASWWGDMAYDPNHEGMWVVDVGGDNAMTLFDMETGEMIDQVIGDWATTSARGVAYDPVNDYLWVSGWNHTEIYCAKGLDWDNPGETVLTIPTPNSVAGLAWNCGEETLWVTSNSTPDIIYELDSETGDILTELAFPDPAGYVGAGCEMDESGNLWVVSQGDLNAYLVETDASGGCYGAGWLMAYPSDPEIVLPDSIFANETHDYTVKVDRTGKIAGNYYGAVQILHNDYDYNDGEPIDVPVVMSIIHGTAVGNAWDELYDVQLLPGEDYTTLFWVENETEATAMMNWELSFDPAVDWVTASQMSGENMLNGERSRIVLDFDSEGLEPGTHSTTINVDWEAVGEDNYGSGTIQSYIYLTIFNPEMQVTPDAFEFSLYAGEQDSAAMTIANLDSEFGGTLYCNLKTTTQNRVSRSRKAEGAANTRANSTSRAISKPVSTSKNVDMSIETDARHLAAGKSYSRTKDMERSPLPPGDVIYEWPTGLGLAWGVGYEPGFVWFSDYNTSMAAQFEADEDGGATGVEIPLNFGGASWWGDMAYDPNHQGMWIVDVGGDNAVTLFDMETGDMIDQVIGDWATTSARGVAYDPVNDYLWVSGWNHTEIYCAKGLDWDNPGETVLTIPTPNSVAGLAWNCGEETVWVTSNSSPDYIYELDSETGAILTELPFPDQAGYVGAGCDMDENGNLWVVSQGTLNAYLVETDASGGCFGSWLSVNPTELAIAGGDEAQAMVKVDATGDDIEAGNTYWGSIMIDHNDPDYEVPYEVPVSMTVIGEGFILGANMDEMDMGEMEFVPYEADTSHSMTLANNGDESGSWEATSDMEEITVEPSSGTLGSGESVEINVTVSYGGMPPGSYSGMITITGSDDGPIEMPVMFTILFAPVPPHLYGEWEVPDESVHLWWDFDWSESAREDRPLVGFQIFRRFDDEDYGNMPYFSTNDTTLTEYYDEDIPYAEIDSVVHYSMKAIYTPGGPSDFGNEVTLALSNIIGDEPYTDVPEAFVLSQNFPNPFNPETKISYAIPTTEHVTLNIYNANGQMIRTLVDEKQVANYYTATWDGRDDTGKEVPGGVYFYTIEAGSFMQTNRMVLLK